MTKSKIGIAIAALAAWASTAMGSVTYNDSGGDVFTGAGGGILDILSVEVSNTATDLTFKFTLAGDVVATDWGKYMVIIDSVAGGDPAGNGWGRPISMPSGADYWIGSWVDSGNGMEVYKYNGTSWPFPPDHATWLGSPGISISKTPATVTINVALAHLGLNLGDTILFDAFTSGGGGGDGAIDSLGNPGQQVADWGEHSDAHPVSYLVVPAPGVLAFAGLGLLAARRRRR